MHRSCSGIGGSYGAFDFHTARSAVRFIRQLSCSSKPPLQRAVAQPSKTKRGAFGTRVITPAEQLYICNNLPAPDAFPIADRDAREISLAGVKSPRKLSVQGLKAMGLETAAACCMSGNMPSYKGKLTEEQIAALAYYVSRATGAE